MDLKEIRISRKLTQQELADLCNIKRSTIAMIETHRSNPSVQVAQRIAKVLGFKWTEFFE